MTLTTWLPTILALVGAAVAWGAFQARLDALSAALTSHRSDAADRDRSSAAKLDKLLDQQGTLVQRLVLIEANREHDRDACYDIYLASTHQPSYETTPPSLVTYPMPVTAYEAGVITGQAGTLNTKICREITYCSTYDQTPDYRRIVLGYDATASSTRYITYWDGVTPVGSVLNRAGVQATIAP